MNSTTKLNLFKYYAPTYRGEKISIVRNGSESVNAIIDEPNIGFKDGLIYFQEPHQLNDPWDSKSINLMCSNRVLEINKDFAKEFYENFDNFLTKQEFFHYHFYLMTN